METATRPSTMPFLQIRYAECTERIAGYVVAAVGLLISLWANCILIVVCLQAKAYSFQHGEMFISRTIVHTSQWTHFIIVLMSTTGLIFGLRESDPYLLLPWMIVKLLELLSLFVGIILLTCEKQEFVGLVPIGLIFLLIGGYIYLSVWDTYRKMQRSSTSEEDSQVQREFLPRALPKDPPSYDSSINQTSLSMVHS